MSSKWFKYLYIDSEGNRGSDSIFAKSLRVATQYIVSKQLTLISIRKLMRIEQLYIQIKHHPLIKFIFVHE